MTEKILKLIGEKVGKDDVHGLGHAMRVRRIALELAKDLGADEEVVELAALLHDVVREGEDHALRSAEEARKILEGLGLDPDKIERVAKAIEDHSYSSGRRPRTLEGMILQDADRLDALGAVGIYRAVAHGERLGRSLEDTLEHMREKLLSLPEKMNTHAGRREALRRVRLIESFLEEMERELE